LYTDNGFYYILITMTETVYSFFEEEGTPVVGLTPSIVGVD